MTSAAPSKLCQLPSTAISPADLKPKAIVRIGLLGAARVAPYAMIEPARANHRAAVVAIAAREYARALRFADQHDIPRVHESYAALLADPCVDLVYIGTPPVTHAALAIAAIAAGKHVLVEKPFALNAVEAATVAAKAKSAGVRVYEAMHSLHHPLFAQIAAIARSGQLGTLIRVNAHFSTSIGRSVHEFRWSGPDGGGALMDLGVYPLCFCRRLLGEAFDVSQVVVEVEGGVDTRATVDLNFNETPARISFSMIDPTSAWLEITGALGVLRAENPVAPSMGHRLTVTTGSEVSSYEFPGPSSWARQLDAVVATVIDDAPFLLGADNPVASMKAVDRIRAHRHWEAEFNA